MLRQSVSIEKAAAGSWERGDLIQRVRQAFEIASRALTAAAGHESKMEPNGEPNPDRDDTGTRLEIRPLVVAKVVAEAAMLLRSATFLRETDNQIARAIDELAYQLIPSARNEQVMAAMCREPALALDHAAAHIHLRDIGYPDARIDRLLVEILQGEDVGGPELLPIVDLERHWLTQIWLGHDGEATAEAGLVDRTCFARPLDVIGSSTVDLYAFTHVVLYISDIGRRAIRWPRPMGDVVADADAGLAAAVDADNFDLAAELLWTWPMLGLPWSPAASFSFGILAATQDEHGFLPGPEYSATNFERLPAELRDEYVLRTSYHATFVMGFLCAAALRPSLAPPAAVPHGSAPGGAIDLIAPLLRTQSRQPRWPDVFQKLDVDCRESLAEFVLTIVLRRAGAAQDLELVREALRVALSCGVTDGPAVHQAVALLRRATILGDIGAASAN